MRVACIAKDGAVAPTLSGALRDVFKTGFAGFGTALAWTTGFAANFAFGFSFKTAFFATDFLAMVFLAFALAGVLRAGFLTACFLADFAFAAGFFFFALDAMIVLLRFLMKDDLRKGVCPCKVKGILYLRSD
jgi:hypothetical protein